MTADRFQEILNQGGILDLSDRALFLVTGEDRTRYLNGQLTNDVASLENSEETLYACTLNAKGGLQGDLFIRAVPDANAYLIDSHSDLREDLLTRLERYLIADDVEIADVTGDWNISHTLGSDSPNSMRVGLPGCDTVHPPDATPPAATLTSEEADTLRILHGIPAWPHELTPGMLPPEAGIEDRAINYAKGCYTGQEVISRMKRAGKTSRSLCQITVASTNPIEIKDATISTTEGTPLGRISSACHHPSLDHTLGLGYVKRVGLDNDTVSLLDPDGEFIQTAKIQTLPITLENTL